MKTEHHTGYCLLGGQPCCSPITEYEYQTEQGYDTSIWRTKANKYTCPLGFEAGIGHVLMTKEKLNQLNVEEFHKLQLGGLEHFTSQEIDVTVAKLLIIKATCLTPSEPESYKSCYLVELVDRRWLLQNNPINATFNIRAPNAETITEYPYYDFSMQGTIPWSWEEAVKNVWNTITDLGPFPGLPIASSTYPEGYQFIGIPALDALKILLTKVFCTLQYDPIADTFSIVALNADDQRFATAEQTFEDYLMFDSATVESNRGKYPSSVRVYFNKKHKFYGQEHTLDSASAEQWINNYYYYVDVPTSIPGADPTNQAVIWDDTYGILDENGILENEGDLISKANFLVVNYTAAILNSDVRHFKRYSTIIDAFIPSSKVKSVAYCLTVGGIYTDVVRNIGIPSLIKNIDCCCEEQSDNLKPADFSRNTYPEYYPQIQIIKIIEDIPKEYYFYKAQVEFPNPVTNEFVKHVDCYVMFEPQPTLLCPPKKVEKNARHFGKVYGRKKIDSRYYPIYLVLDKCEKSKYIKIISTTPSLIQDGYWYYPATSDLTLNTGTTQIHLTCREYVDIIPFIENKYAE